MSRPFDSTMRQLIEWGPAAWLKALGIPISDNDRVKVIDTNLSTINAEADRAILVEGPSPWIEHIEVQAGRDAHLHDRAHFYNTLLEHHHGVPVRTTLVLLRPAADGPELTGVRESRRREGDVYDWFKYDVVRVWQRPVETFLEAGPHVLPLAPVADVGQDRLREVLTIVADRLKAEAPPDQAALLWKATALLLALRYRKEQIAPIVDEVAAMSFEIHGIEGSWLYQEWLEQYQQGLAAGKAEGLNEGLAVGKAEGLAAGKAEGLNEGLAVGKAEGKAVGKAEGLNEGLAVGKAEGLNEGRIAAAQQALLLVGGAKLGQPDARTRAEIERTANLERLNQLLLRALDVSSWDELLAPAGSEAHG